jgi:hypothetical protein
VPRASLIAGAHAALDAARCEVGWRVAREGRRVGWVDGWMDGWMDGWGTRERVSPPLALALSPSRSLSLSHTHAPTLQALSLSLAGAMPVDLETRRAWLGTTCTLERLNEQVARLQAFRNVRMASAAEVVQAREGHPLRDLLHMWGESGSGSATP